MGNAQTVTQYKAAFRKKSGESEADAKVRMEDRIKVLLKQGKLVEG